MIVGGKDDRETGEHQSSDTAMDAPNQMGQDQAFRRTSENWDSELQTPKLSLTECKKLALQIDYPRLTTGYNPRLTAGYRAKVKK